MERFHFNPIPLNQYSRILFPNIETFHIYNKEDEIFEDGRIFKQIIWYKVDYSKYLEEKKAMNEYKNIEYTEEDRKKYGNTIPIEVNSVGEYCFYWCDDIQEIEIPTNVSKIGDGCFRGCSSLTSIEILTNISKIGNECFEYCISLESINIEDIKYISEERIFMNESVLISIKIPENLKIINGKNIEKKDINEFIIPSSIIKIENGCFKSCSSLTSIEIPSSVTEIGKYCFSGCSSLTMIDIPSSVRKIGEGCFEYCTSLSSINIPTSITSIGNRCFYHCGCEEELKKNKPIPKYCFTKY
ncbi:hypothetical protein ENUP19_0068G0007 [Entamoeba nuttalli]|uniref:Leucine rich repeat protein, BspA family protein n=1 Tax=Entamoeba nuttalli TaxID=412467 RepID=A0ABQ0DE73_9EUKA